MHGLDYPKIPLIRFFFKNTFCVGAHTGTLGTAPIQILTNPVCYPEISKRKQDVMACERLFSQLLTTCTGVAKNKYKHGRERFTSQVTKKLILFSFCHHNNLLICKRAELAICLGGSDLKMATVCVVNHRQYMFLLNALI